MASAATPTPRSPRENPFALPPGPERRETMLEQGYNIGPDDWTEQELADAAAHAREIFAAAPRS